MTWKSFLSFQSISLLNSCLCGLNSGFSISGIISSSVSSLAADSLELCIYHLCLLLAYCPTIMSTNKAFPYLKFFSESTTSVEPIFQFLISSKNYTYIKIFGASTYKAKREDQVRRWMRYSPKCHLLIPWLPLTSEDSGKYSDLHDPRSHIDFPFHVQLCW